MTIAIESVLETEIFINEGGNVSIKQIDSYGDEEVVEFPIEYIDSVVNTLLALKAE